MFDYIFQGVVATLAISHATLLAATLYAVMLQVDVSISFRPKHHLIWITCVFFVVMVIKGVLLFPSTT